MSDYLLNLRKRVGHDLLPMAAVSVVTFDDQGRVLMVKHTTGGDVWVLPGGSVDPPELCADAAIREMWEETGLLIEPVRVLGVYNGPKLHITYRNQDQVAYYSVVFEGKVKGGALRPDGVEVTEVAYVSQAELAGLRTLPWVHVVLADVFQRANTALFQPPTWQPPLDDIRIGGISDFLRGIRQKIGTELLLTASVGAVVYDDRGHLLLQKRADNGYWSGPAGGLEPYETPADGAVREIWEETGIIAKPTRILGVYGGPEHFNQFSNGDKIITYGTIFECQAIGGSPTPDGYESTEVAFFPLDNLPLDEMSPRWAERIDALTTYRDQPFFDPPSWQPPAKV